MPVVFRVKLGKTGNSLKITLPHPIIEGFGWKEGDEIVLYVAEEQITLGRPLLGGASTPVLTPKSGRSSSRRHSTGRA